MLFYCTSALQLLIGIGAVAAGIGFILKPDGSNLGMPVELLGEAPFEDYLIPGIVLLTINGLGSILGCLLSFRCHPFAGKVTMILGVAMVIWISIQVYWMGLISWLQPVYFVVGIIEIFLGAIIGKKSGH